MQGEQLVVVPLNQADGPGSAWGRVSLQARHVTESHAPPESSIALTRQWAAAGRPITVHVYEGAGHGIYQQGTDTDGRAYHYKDPRYIADLIAWLRDLPHT